MDPKDIPWIGNMCQKIESFCVEVEEIVYQDTTKYVEDQIRTVGETFKKLYSDTMQDLCPLSSSSPVEAETRQVAQVHSVAIGETFMKAFSEVCEIPTVKLEESLNANEAKQIVESPADIPYSNNVVNNGSCCSETSMLNASINKDCGELFTVSEPHNETNEAKQMVKSSADIPYSNNVVNNGSCSFETSVLNASMNKDCGELFTVSEPHNETNEAKQMVKSSADISNSNNVVNSGSCSSETSMLNASMNKDDSELFTLSEPHNGSDKFLCRVRDLGLKLASVVDQESHSEENEVAVSESVKEINGSSGNYSCAFEGSNGKVTAPPSERSNLMTTEKTEDNDAVKSEVLVIEQVEKANLEQSCVLVGTNQNTLRLPLQNKHKSYKKNIRNAFSRTRWLKGKQEEEQIDVWYIEDSVVLNSSSHSSDSFDDSDWELV